MNSYNNRRIDIIAYSMWAGFSLIAGMIIPGPAICAAANEPQVDYSSNEITPQPLWSMQEIIVKFEDDISEDYRNAIIREHGCSAAGRCLFTNLQLVQIPEYLTAAETVDIFQEEETVDYAELNYYARISLVPDDTFYPFQWNLNNGISGGIDTEAAWDIQTGDPNVIVAVLDTGVAYEDFETFKQAPDLAGTSFVFGYDFVNEDSHPNDDQGHGTHVTGTIAQNTNNGIGELRRRRRLGHLKRRCRLRLFPRCYSGVCHR
jgi:subtilisin family serine protease